MHRIPCCNKLQYRIFQYPSRTQQYLMQLKTQTWSQAHSNYQLVRVVTNLLRQDMTSLNIYMNARQEKNYLSLKQKLKRTPKKTSTKISCFHVNNVELFSQADPHWRSIANQSTRTWTWTIVQHVDYISVQGIFWKIIPDCMIQGGHSGATNAQLSHCASKPEDTYPSMNLSSTIPKIPASVNSVTNLF